MNGKGSKQRPLSVDYSKFAKNWDDIFSKKTTAHLKSAQVTDEALRVVEINKLIKLIKK